MKKFFSFASLSEKFIRLTERMPVSILLIVVLATLTFISANKYCDISVRWFVFCPAGLFISVAATLWLEDHVKDRWLRYGATLIGVALWGIYCLLFLPEEFADWLQIVVLSAVFFFANFFIPFLAKNKDRTYWRFSAEILFQILIAGCFGGLLFGGLCMAVFAVNILFNAHINDVIYMDLLIICMLLFVPLYFLANIPGQKEKHESEISINRIFTITALYILTPLLVIYAAILYAYLIRIIILWELPNGWVSLLVSALALGGLAVITVVYPIQTSENRLVRWLSRYSGLVILPLLILMTVGIGKRINDYGISINRCYILLLNIWFYGIYIYLFVTKAKHVKWILISPVVIMFLASTGPWKISSITKRTLLNKMETVFDGRQLTVYNSVSWFNELDTERKLEISETLKYLADNYGTASVQAFFKDELKQKHTIYKMFSDLQLNETKNFRHFFFFSNDTEPVNINDYQFCIMCSFQSYNSNKKEDKNIEIKLDSMHLNMRIIPHNRYVSFPIGDLVLKYTQQDNTSSAMPLLEAIDNDDTAGEASARRYSLAVKELTGKYDMTTDSVYIDDFKGILFYK